MVVGRADGRVGADVEIDDASLSRRHAEFVATPDGWELRDLGSTNGTRIASVALAAGEARKVHEGDVLRFGSVEVRVDRR
jgi:pSer/pThr/pTyr-binding forkhead associated (FHA) protein